MSEISDYDITEAMLTYGGSFAQGLGKLWRLGDDINQARLKRTFPEFWAKYRELAMLKAERASTQAKT